MVRVPVLEVVAVFADTRYETAPLPVPEPTVLFTTSRPRLTVVPPVYVLLPLRVSGPVPILVSEPLP